MGEGEAIMTGFNPTNGIFVASAPIGFEIDVLVADDLASGGIESVVGGSRGPNELHSFMSIQVVAFDHQDAVAPWCGFSASWIPIMPPCGFAWRGFAAVG